MWKEINKCYFRNRKKVFKMILSHKTWLLSSEVFSLLSLTEAEWKRTRKHKWGNKISECHYLLTPNTAVKRKMKVLAVPVNVDRCHWQPHPEIGYTSLYLLSKHKSPRECHIVHHASSLTMFSCHVLTTRSCTAPLLRLSFSLQARISDINDGRF